eukprot:CAMPEP_0170480570 /NCGR_PEP_ID=MMETSP0208-20121228/1360_1 /TAXON_ID=197538 /ORGANISM="Strombidium inclinatum, Strain S3" /LENGTH=41 /DNA_ID= /DNA_START= /DNA_END= /DNA_ORIENTATION=
MANETMQDSAKEYSNSFSSDVYREMYDKVKAGGNLSQEEKQ